MIVKEITIQQKPCLILIDLQEGFNDFKVWGKRNNINKMERNIKKLLDFWRENNLPIIHVKHLSLEPNSNLRKDNPGSNFMNFATPLMESEIIIHKNVNSAFIGTDLESILLKNAWEHVVLVGLTSDHCVNTTCRMARNLGFFPIMVSDATATFDRTSFDGTLFEAEKVHEIHLASLHQEFARVLPADELLELLI